MAATARAWARWGARHGLDGAAIQAANHGRPAREVVAAHVVPERLDAEAAYLLDAEVADTGGVDALPGAARVLALPTVAIATSCVAPLARARLSAAGLGAPAVLVTADQVTHGKPAPDSYLLAAERLGVDPAGCLVLEDAPSGVAARSEEHTSELQSLRHLVCRLLLEKKKKRIKGILIKKKKKRKK